MGSRILPPMHYLIRFLPSERSVRVSPGTTLLEAAREAGLPVAQTCTGEGICARCGMQIVEGSEGLAAETVRETTAKARNRVDTRLRLSCLLLADRDFTVTAPYW
ncbi:MAG TPA: 2Fe-2S iron-sulfur cluster binding domain-containing protein [Myxococcales bacterium]|nr:2Fe-2S iron-sulfur cluster binding domain-containing protein [Myxococcales bacterium]HIL01648.1 2Fe-2S iron-sulfur cluster binding domain-containing protein [Myxococcales bacterium]